MLDSKFFFTLVGLFVAVFAICNTNMSPAISEGFWGLPSRQLSLHREVRPNKGSMKGSYGIQTNYESMLGTGNFYSQPNYQGLLSPRINPPGLGSTINYNLPDYDNNAVPSHPLSMADMAKNDYGENCNDNVDITNSIMDDGVVSPDGAVPVGDMTTINSDGQVEMPHVYERHIFANANSRLRGQGDNFRGDLQIVPCYRGMYDVFPNPATDLHQGVMSMVGGETNETSRALSEMIYTTSGGTSGNSYSNIDISHDLSTTIGAGMKDITVSGFA
jgi:hypothetical protein